MKLNGKTVLLAGASGGIGSAIALRLEAAGAELVLASIDEPGLEQVAEQLAGAHEIVVADITEADGRNRIRDACAAQGVDIVINATGVLNFQLYEDQDPSAIERQMNINLLAPMQLIHALMPLLRQREESAIVNIGSIFGSIGHPGFTAYCASKFGLRGFTEALQRELADTQVRVLYLAPRATRTALNSSAVDALNEALGNRVDTPSTVAGELMALLGGTRSQRYIGWPEKLFVRVNALLPGLVARALTGKLHIIRQYAVQ